MTFATTCRSTYPAHLAYLQRGYEAAMAAHGFDAIVLCSGTPVMKNRFDDQVWTLCPTPAFTHWCPLAEADAFVVVRAGKKPTLVRTIVVDFWETTPRPDSDHFWSEFELVEVQPGLAGDVLPGGKVAVITRDPGKSPPGAVNSAAVVAALDQLRAHKTAYEVACLDEATRRAVRGHRAIEQQFRSGTPSELDLHLGYLAATEQDESSCPHKNIIALGTHAAVLHHSAYTRERVAGDTSLLVAAGAKCLGYGSAITRTYGRGASAKRFAELVVRFEALQQEIIRAIKPGLPYEDLHDESHRLLATVLHETGIGRGKPDELVARGVTRVVFPHGLVHSLGVTVHDAGMKPHPPRPDNPFLLTTSTIEPGHVLAIEPGFYVIDSLLGPLQSDDRRELIDWAAIAALRPFGGIRIGDNVVVEATGVRNLTRDAFATPATP